MFSIEIVTQNASINEVQERKEKKKKRNTWNWIIYSINDNKQLNSIKKKKKKAAEWDRRYIERDDDWCIQSVA